LNIAVLGAECTGKSALVQALVAHFNGTTAPHTRSLSVPEHLRQWCDHMGRTPLAHEQAGIAQRQSQAIADATAALGTSGVVVADTTALITATYSIHYFQDDTLLSTALANQRAFDHTLLMGLDLPWQADGVQRDGPHARQAIDALLRHHLTLAEVPYQVVYGAGAARLANALAALAHAPPATGWACPAHDRLHGSSACAQCGDAWAERQLFSRLLSIDRSPPQRDAP
jgi:nicotinamide riboside kinase